MLMAFISAAKKLIELHATQETVPKSSREILFQEPLERDLLVWKQEDQEAMNHFDIRKVCSMQT